MQTFYTILNYINTILVTLCGLAFMQQFIYMLLFFLPAKKYKQSEIKKKFAIFIPARNESEVIGNTVKSVFNQNYPKDLFDVYVIADNCTDNTAEIARQAGAIVLEHFDDNPKHKRVSYPIQYFFDYILKEKDIYDAFIRFDADNLVDPNYINEMNNALCSGAKLARGYNHAKNLTENVCSGISGLWYIRDCRFSCQARSNLGCTQIMVGSGMMIDANVIREDGGWTAMGISEDAEFSMDQLFKGNKVKYVSTAIVYEDQPTTLKDAYNRNVRMGKGLIKLFFTHGLKSLGKFFTKFDYAYLDMFFNFLFIPIAIVCCLWLPLFYGFDIFYHWLALNDIAYIIKLAKFIGIILLCAFILPFILQAIFVYVLDKKKINVPFKKLLPSILMFPMFMIIYAVAVTIGALTKPKWKKINRSKNTTAIIVEDEEKSEIVNIEQETIDEEFTFNEQEIILSEELLNKLNNIIATDKIEAKEQ